MKEIRITVVKNGYLVIIGNNLSQSGDDEYVFESFDTLTKWLKENIALVELKPELKSGPSNN